MRGGEGEDESCASQDPSSSDSLPPSLRHHTLRTAEGQEEGRARAPSLHPSLSSDPRDCRASICALEAGRREDRRDGGMEGWRHRSRRAFPAPGVRRLV